MEEKIELMLLEKFKDRIGNNLEKKEVMQAYYNRKDNLAKTLEPKDITQMEKREDGMNMEIKDIDKVIRNNNGEELSKHTFEDIGKYTIFPPKMWKRMFPSSLFGNYEKDELFYSNIFGLMTREEGLRITNDLARLTLPHERNVDYEKLMTLENTGVKHEIVKDEQKFVAILQDFSNSVLDYINS